MPRYHVASISSDMALVSGLWGGATTKLMLDSGSSVSLVKKDFVDSKPVKFTRLITNTHINLVTASGDHLPIVDQVEAIVTIGSHTGSHTFLIVHDLIAPVILGLDFFRANKLAIDFTTVPPTVYQRQGTTTQRVCTIVTDESSPTEEFKDCAIPALNKAEIKYPAALIVSCKTSFRIMRSYSIPSLVVLRQHAITSLRLHHQSRFHLDAYQFIIKKKYSIRSRTC